MKKAVVEKLQGLGYSVQQTDCGYYQVQRDGLVVQFSAVVRSEHQAWKAALHHSYDVQRSKGKP